MLILAPDCAAGRHTKSEEDFGFAPKVFVEGCEYSGRLDYYCARCGKMIESKGTDHFTAQEMTMIENAKEY